MRVILDTWRAGRGSVQRPGDAIDVDEKEGRALVNSGQARIETAMQEPRKEKAATRTGRGR